MRKEREPMWFFAPIGPYGYSPFVWCLGFIVVLLLAALWNTIQSK